MSGCLNAHFPVCLWISFALIFSSLALLRMCMTARRERESGNEGVREERGEQGVGGVEGWGGEESKVSVETSSISKEFIYNVQPNTRWR